MNMKKALAAALCFTAIFSAGMAFSSCGSSENDGYISVVVPTQKPGESKPGQRPGTTTTYTVSFDSDGGTAVQAVKVKKGEKISEPATPQKATLQRQYSFLGWYNGETKWNFSNDTVQSNVTLTAKWELAEDYTIGFKPQS